MDPPKFATSLTDTASGVRCNARAVCSTALSAWGCAARRRAVASSSLSVTTAAPRPLRICSSSSECLRSRATIP
jgi:hypothetical protein